MAWDVSRCTFHGKSRFNMMLTSGENTTREDGSGYKYDSGHPDFYRCPVSTPANNSKRPLEDYDPITNTIAPELHEKKSVIGFSRPSVSRNRTRDVQKPMRKNVEYYFVDKHVQQHEAKQTNTFWLQSLCAQPVTEILGKYRRKSDFQRTRYMWSKTFSTPGERALLEAWSTNTGPSHRVATSMGMKAAGRQILTYSREIKVSTEPSVVSSAKSTISRRTEVDGSADELRPLPRSTSGCARDQSKRAARTVTQDSPMVRIDTGDGDDVKTSNMALNDGTDGLPQLSGKQSRRKGQIVLQQRKYFSGNRKHPAIPHVQTLNPVKTEDIAKTPDVICLIPSQRSVSPFATPRNMVQSRDSPSRARERVGSAHSMSDIDKTQVKFPLIVSTRTDTGASEQG
ncbi:uncharacterized protein LOC124127400 isoform X1 [Haliotis rufescens]|uniref:uncharacterized protein LOC124127400 isoform X1 n=2 Tax=Haliotis rufescens TaxID=6454 RepID=UPI00201F8946|nr:uncharacterized protein LOC124127400 isoform X1 [Haliotis rufescens]